MLFSATTIATIQNIYETQYDLFALKYIAKTLHS